MWPGRKEKYNGRAKLPLGNVQRKRPPVEARTNGRRDRGDVPTKQLEGESKRENRAREKVLLCAKRCLLVARFSFFRIRSCKKNDSKEQLILKNTDLFSLRRRTKL